MRDLMRLVRGWVRTGRRCPLCGIALTGVRLARRRHCPACAGWLLSDLDPYPPHQPPYPPDSRRRV